MRRLPDSTVAETDALAKWYAAARAALARNRPMTIAATTTSDQAAHRDLTAAEAAALQAVGAFKDEKSAQKAHDELQKKFGSDVPGLEVVAPSGSEKRHVLASGPMTEEDAKSACAKLKKAHQACEVLKRG